MHNAESRQELVDLNQKPSTESKDSQADGLIMAIYDTKQTSPENNLNPSDVTGEIGSIDRAVNIFLAGAKEVYWKPLPEIAKYLKNDR